MAVQEYRACPDLWTTLSPDAIISELNLAPQPTDLDPANNVTGLLDHGQEFDLTITDDHVDKIRRLFPAERKPATILAMAVWLWYACKFDDHIEHLSPKRALEVLSTCRRLLGSAQSGDCVVGPIMTDPGITMTRDLLSHLHRLLPDREGRVNVVNLIMEVLEGFGEEVEYLNEKCSDMERYMQVRNKTISVKPLFAMLIIGVDMAALHNDHSDLCLKLRALEHQISTMIGLQNDLLGLRRDVEDCRTMNFVLVHSKHAFSGPDTERTSDEDLRTGAHAAIEQHNKASFRAAQLHQYVMSCANARIRQYSCQVYALPSLHSKFWMGLPRYQDTVR